MRCYTIVSEVVGRVSGVKGGRGRQFCCYFVGGGSVIQAKWVSVTMEREYLVFTSAYGPSNEKSEEDVVGVFIELNK